MKTSNGVPMDTTLTGAHFRSRVFTRAAKCFPANRRSTDTSVRLALEHVQDELVPLVIAVGAGSEMRQAIGIAVFSGMLRVTFFGLFLTPVFFVTLETFMRKGAGAEPGATAGSTPGCTGQPCSRPTLERPATALQG